MKKKYLVVLLLLALVSVILFVSSILLSSALSKSIKAQYEYQAHVKVGDYIGFNLQEDKIYFGTVYPGGFGKRAISLNSTISGYVVLRVQGPMQKFMYTTDEYGLINDGEEISYTFYVHPPNNVEEGVYESKLIVYVLENRNPFLEFFLEGEPLKAFPNPDEAPKPGGALKVNISYPNITDSSN